MSEQDLEARVQALESQLDELRAQLMESQLDDWKARIDQLEVQAHLGEMEAADQINPLLDQLRNRWLDAQEQFEKGRSSAGDAVSTVADGVRSALTDLRTALSDAANKVTPGR